MNRESLKRHCEAMCEKFKGVPTSGAYGEHRLVLDLLEQTRWIPVSERLPKIAGIYRVTRYYPNNVMNPEYIVDACAFDGSNTWYDDNRINHERAYADNVIAWQENPEPYEIPYEIQESEDKWINIAEDLMPIIDEEGSEEI